MANKIRLRIVTPSRLMFDEMVEMVIMRGQEGDLGVLSGHAPLTTGLDIGVIYIDTHVANEKVTISAAIHGGFVEIRPDMITLLTDNAEWPNEIDKERAEASKQRADERIAKNDSINDLDRANISLKKSLIRIQTSKLSGHELLGIKDKG
jgi:F-type H+-transporting ATPase subunit epsilon